MKLLKIILALVLTLVLLFIARKLAMVQSRTMVIQSGAHSLSHLNPGKTAENQNLNVELELSPNLASGQKAVLNFRYGNGVAEWSMAEMSTFDGKRFKTLINGQPKGVPLSYYFEVQDSLGSVVGNLGSEQKPLKLRFEGEIPASIMIPHIFCMFAGAFFAFLAFFGTFSLLKGTGDITAVAREVAWTTLFVFVGEFPLGIMVTRAALGGLGWGGFPFGNDITDTKTLIIFLYWLAQVVLAKGSIFQKNPEKNLVKPGTYGLLTLVGFILFLGLYPIPHSL
jgi:hypothetical protein